MAENQKLEFNKDALFGFNLAYSANDFTPEMAHEKLMAVTGVEVMTLEEVKDQFEKIKAGQWNLVEEDPAPTPKTLDEMLRLNVVADNVFKYFNLDDRLILRKVSHFYKDLVREQPLKIKELSIKTNGQNCMSIGADNFVIEYLNLPSWINNGRGIMIKKGDTMKIVTGPSLELLVNEARSILDCKNLAIGEFSSTLNLTQHFEPIINRALRFKIRKLSVPVELPEDIRYALSIAHVKSIEEIWIQTEHRDRSFYIDVVSDWKLQWKKAKVLVSEMRFKTSAFVKDFGHFDYMCFVLNGQRISLGVLEKLKETLLLRTTVEQIEIIPDESHPPTDPIFLIPPASFRPFRSQRSLSSHTPKLQTCSLLNMLTTESCSEDRATEGGASFTHLHGNGEWWKMSQCWWSLRRCMLTCLMNFPKINDLFPEL
ncbi:hypothetical protein CAEBREN_03923 [Caenorhabditis brenneri]|uniref:DUF38 domain-containing protein n=1 Tax=Caenorhabditis brenneri TaxID=135651 RepID=G0NUD5_CAEBE|nr:hypothetical protein CAEBREN_03923 [Caenorhabditis brenneri]